MYKVFSYWRTVNIENINTSMILGQIFQVIFTDENEFNLFGCDGRDKVWRKLYGTFRSWKLKFGEDGVMNKHILYMAILKNNLKESVQKLGIEDNFQFFKVVVQNIRRLM